MELEVDKTTIYDIVVLSFSIEMQPKEQQMETFTMSAVVAGLKEGRAFKRPIPPMTGDWEYLRPHGGSDQVCIHTVLFQRGSGGEAEVPFFLLSDQKRWGQHGWRKDDNPRR